MWVKCVHCGRHHGVLEDANPFLTLALLGWHLEPWRRYFLCPRSTCRKATA